MPLSEDEQRVLRDIEKNFYDSDPEFADVVGEQAMYRHGKRNIKFAIGGFVLSLTFLLATFVYQPFLAIIGFVGMVASALILVQNARRLGAVGLRDVADSQRMRQVQSSLGDQSNKLKRKFGQD